MKRTLITLFFAAASLTVAQTRSENYSGHGYAYFGVGKILHEESGGVLNVGGGGEGFVYRGLAAGADLGYLFPRECPRCGLGLLSANPAYHFKGQGRSRTLVPFVTGGYSLLFRGGHAGGVNYGGGVTWWAGNSWGLRFEVRNHQFTRRSFDDSILLFRVGFSFR
jgi:hypothetical protein